MLTGTGAGDWGTSPHVPQSTHGDNFFACRPVIYLCTICRYAIHQEPDARSRAEKGQCRAPHPVAPRRPGAPRLRAEQADRTAIRRPAEVPRRVAVPAALPTREARLDSGPLDREGRTAPPSLLPSDARRRQRARLAARHLARVRSRDQQDYRSRACLTGLATSAKNFGSTSTTSTTSCARPVVRTMTPCAR